MHDTAVDTLEINGLTVSIYHDQDCSSPRENDNLGTIATWHRRYRLGDVQPAETPDDYIKGLPKGSIVLPVWMYEHSGIALSCGGRSGQFADRWDSGQLGVIWASPEQIRANYLVKRITKKTRQQAIELLTCEIDEYSKYVGGECYGYVVEDATGDQLDSCWGFIGYEYAQQTAREAGEACAKDREDKRAADREMYDDG